MKRLVFLVVGTCLLLISFGFVLLMAQYLFDGAGLQTWIPIVSPGSVLMGTAHVIGFCALAVVSFAAGSLLCAEGWVGTTAKNAEHAKEK